MKIKSIILVFLAFFALPAKGLNSGALEQYNRESTFNIWLGLIDDLDKFIKINAVSNF